EVDFPEELDAGHPAVEGTDLKQRLGHRHSLVRYPAPLGVTRAKRPTRSRRRPWLCRQPATEGRWCSLVARHDPVGGNLLARAGVRIDDIHARPAAEPGVERGLSHEDRGALRAIALLNPDLLTLLK